MYCVFKPLPDPGALNSCMHTFPEKMGLLRMGLLCIWMCGLIPLTWMCDLVN